MNEVINAGSIQLSALAPFVALYINKVDDSHTIAATYLVTDKNRTDGRELFYHRVQVNTGKTLAIWFADDLNEQARKALAAQYTARYTKEDAIILMAEFITDREAYADMDMPTHPLFGRSVFYADIGEIDLGGGKYMCM